MCVGVYACTHSSGEGVGWIPDPVEVVSQVVVSLTRVLGTERRGLKKQPGLLNAESSLHSLAQVF